MSEREPSPADVEALLAQASRLEDESKALLGEARRLEDESSRRLGALLLLLALLACASLAAWAGESLILGASAPYRALEPWIFLACLPIAYVLVARSDRRTKIIARDHPSPLVRRLIAYPLLAAAWAFMATGVPLGLAVLYALALGTPAQVEGRLLSLESGSWNPYCTRAGVVDVGGRQARMCVTNSLVGSYPAPGARLRLTGLQSAAGLYVRRTEVR